MPSGSAAGSASSYLEFDQSKSTGNRLVSRDTSFHHMTESGIYDGWTEHQVIVTPSLASAIDLAHHGQGSEPG
jgi:hypothetical protein